MHSLENWLKHPNAPILALIVCNIVVGLLTVKTYGLTLDEPFYYSYGEAIGYAYSPNEWFSGTFDLENSYGTSEWDHRDRGPAYLLLARTPAKLLQEYADYDLASSWHLINFIVFQVGVLFLFIFLQRWVSREAAFATTLLFTLQPILWGHAFINPKDPPFLVFFLMSTELGFRMVEKLTALPKETTRLNILKIISFPAIVMGLATNMRILGPLSGLLVFIYYLQQGHSPKDSLRWLWFIAYGLIGFVVFFLCWPYLWQYPLQRIQEVLLFMSDNPTELRVLFYGQIFTADQLPVRYLPTMLALTLTEPIWILALFGLIISFHRRSINKRATQTLILCLAWFAIPILYALIRRPAMYDGFRHSLFILPPIFALIGIGIDSIFIRLTSNWLKVLITVLLIFPGLFGIIKLFPYEYTYYNQFVGGTGKASYQFETDYWGTCYKEAVDIIKQSGAPIRRVFVGAKGIPVVHYYLGKAIKLREYSRSQLLLPGDYIISTSRANNVLQLYKLVKDNSIKIGREDAIFCRIQLRKPVK